MEIAVLGSKPFWFKLRELPELIEKGGFKAETILQAFIAYVGLKMDVEMIRVVGLTEETLRPLYVVIEHEIALRSTRRRGAAPR